MKKIFFLIVVLFLIDSISAQHKTMTIYYSGGTTDVVNLSGTDSIVIFICGASKVKYGGKDYNTVLIGNQCWLKENLDIGTMINGNQTPDPTPGGTIEKYCHNNNLANCSTYGGLYQWNEAMQYITTEGAKGICPAGWHIPSSAEYQTLINFVNNDGNALKREDQGSGAGQGTNTSGFSALLAGYRFHTGSSFGGLNGYGYIWSSTEASATNARYFYLNGDNNNTNIAGSEYKSFGFSLRCIRD